MIIRCTTARAAGTVLSLLMQSSLHIGRDYTVSPVLAPAPPFVFTINIPISSTAAAALRAIPNTTIT
jgi:hypothetical protein